MRPGEPLTRAVCDKLAQLRAAEQTAAEAFCAVLDEHSQLGEETTARYTA
jgi:hypothetical protein